MATIREIAQLAGVSRGTVDRVLNKRGSVNKETEEKILEIVKRLDYKPNRAGLVLAAQRKNLKIGVILFGVKNPFFDDVIEGIEKKANEYANYNCRILIKRVDDTVAAQLQAIDDFVKEDINGLAIAPYNNRLISKRLAELTGLGIPVVTLNTDIENSGRMAYVGSNYYLSGQTAAGLMNLVTHGNVKCGIVTGFEDVLCHSERIAGFRSRIEAEYHNIEIVDTVLNGDDDFISYDRTTKLLKDHPEINALFFAAGGVYGGCRAVTALNRQNSLNIITFDDTRTNHEYIHSNLISATICQHPQAQGEIPIEILFKYLTTGEMPENEINYVDVDIRIKENL